MLGNLLDLILTVFRYMRMSLEGLWWVITNSSTFGGLLYDTFSYLPPFLVTFLNASLALSAFFLVIKLWK